MGSPPLNYCKGSTESLTFIPFLSIIHRTIFDYPYLEELSCLTVRLLKWKLIPKKGFAQDFHLLKQSNLSSTSFPFPEIEPLLTQLVVL